jgi:hypothetical protein
MPTNQCIGFGMILRRRATSVEIMRNSRNVLKARFTIQVKGANPMDEHRVKSAITLSKLSTGSPKPTRLAKVPDPGGVAVGHLCTIRRPVLVGALGLGLLVKALIIAGPAAAGVANLEVVSGVTLQDSSSPKSISVGCPRGKMALSGGAYVEGGVNASQSVHIDGLVPYVIGSGFLEATASEWAGGFDEDWRLHVYAVCGDRPKGFEINTAYSTTDSNFLHSAVAECTTGKKLIGFGGQASTAPGPRVALTGIFPAAHMDRVLVQAYEEEGGESNIWTTEAIAVCADPIPGMYVLPQSSLNDSTTSKFVGNLNACSQVHGYGFGIFGGGQAWLTSLYFDEELQSAIAIAVEDANGYANPWYLIGLALCG